MAAICQSIRPNCINPIIQCAKKIYQTAKDAAVRIWTIVSNFFLNISNTIQQALSRCMGFNRNVRPQPQPPVNQVLIPVQNHQPGPQLPPIQENGEIEARPIRPMPDRVRRLNGAIEDIVELPNGEFEYFPGALPAINPNNQVNNAQGLLPEVQNRLRKYCNLPINRDLNERGLIELYTNQRLYQSGLLEEGEMNGANERAQNFSPDSSIAFIRHAINLHQEFLSATEKANFLKLLGEYSEEVISIIPSLCIRALVFTPDDLQAKLNQGNFPLALKDKKLIKGEYVPIPEHYLQRALDLRNQFMNLPDACKKVVLDRRTVGDGNGEISDAAREVINKIHTIAGDLAQGNFAYDQALMKAISWMLA